MKARGAHDTVVEVTESRPGGSGIRIEPSPRIHLYWRMLFVAVGLADDPWEPAVLLDQNKEFCGRMPIPDAAALVETTLDSLRFAERDIADEGQPSFLARTERARTLVIRAGKDVLSIDGDDRAEVPKILTLYRALRATGCQTIILTSGRVPDIPNPTHGGPNPFGLHLWAWGLAPTQLEHFQSLARDLDLRRSPWLRAPWSPHPSGAPMESLFFTDPDDKLDIATQLAAVVVLEERGRQRLYGARKVRTSPRRTPRPAPRPAAECDRLPSELPAKWKRLLREGSPKGTRSAEIGRFLLAAANAGWTWPMVREALTDPTNGLSARVLERPADRLRWLEEEWNRALRKVAQSPPVRSRADVLDEIDRLIASAMSSPRKVASQQLVYEHHLAVAKRLGTLQYRLDVRTLAQETGYTVKTISYANHALVRAGLLGPLDAEIREPMQATRWKVCPRGNNLYPPRGELTVTSRTLPNHDLWRHHKGLGKACFKVYRLLDRTRAVTAKQLPLAIGYIGATTAYRHLRTLESHGLAERWQGGWRRGSADLDLVALKLGVYGMGLRQREQHRQERKEYQESLKSVPCPGCGEVKQTVPRKNLKPNLCPTCRAERRAGALQHLEDAAPPPRERSGFRG